MNLVPSARRISESPTTTSNGLGANRENMRSIPMVIDLLCELWGSSNEATQAILSQSIEEVNEFHTRAIGFNMMQI